MVWLTVSSFLLAGCLLFVIFLLWFSDRETNRRGRVRFFSIVALCLAILGVASYPDTWDAPFRERIDYAQFRQDLLDCRYDEVAYEKNGRGTLLHLKAELKNYFKSELSLVEKAVAMEDLDEAKRSCNLKVAGR